MPASRRLVHPAPPDDINLTAAGLLSDMAALQTTERAQFGYKRAAKSVVTLPYSIVDVAAAAALHQIPYVGPSSRRILAELVAQGRSPTVEKALAASAKAPQIEAGRLLRSGFLSHVAMTQVLSAPARKGIVRRSQYRGDFQMHSTWSDGAVSIAAMVDGAIALGHSCLGITDHSYGLPVAHGMSMADAVRQHREIDALNASHAGRFRIFKGIEANILADGTLDLQREERRAFEFVVASPHSMLRRQDDQTSRMLGAVHAEGVAILGHPTGRMYNSRAGVQADWDRVFEAAASRRVAIEIDGNWHRQDIDFTLARRAVAAGCLFALDSDAHAVDELAFIDYAIAQATLALIPTASVINTWSDVRIAEWMQERRS